MLASKAAYLASLIRGDLSAQIVAAAGNHPNAAVRVAAATGLQHPPEQQAGPIADRLLGDQDVGVRKLTVKSAAAFRSPAMRSRLEAQARREPEPMIRDLITQTL